MSFPKILRTGISWMTTWHMKKVAKKSNLSAYKLDFYFKVLWKTDGHTKSYIIHLWVDCQCRSMGRIKWVGREGTRERNRKRSKDSVMVITRAYFIL